MPSSATPEQPAPPAPRGWRTALQIWWRPLLFFMIVLGLAAGLYHFRHDLTLHQLAHRQTELRDYQAVHPWLLVLGLFAIYTLGTGLFLPVSVTLSLFSGWLLGWWEGALLSSFANVAGCTVAMLISRYLLRSAISHRFATQLERADKLIARDGALYLVSLRLVHVIPSWLINLLIGWTDLRVTTFWWATQLGTLPATLLYTYLGSRFPSLEDLHRADWAAIVTLPRVAMFVALALVPLAIKPLMRRPET